MTEYGKSPQYTSATSLPSHDFVLEAKEKRKKLLDEIWQRRRENYKHFMEKKRQEAQADGEWI